MLLLIDNYDSFTYNIYQLLSELGAEVEVIRNDQTTVEKVACVGYAGLILSPGPGVPAEAGISEDLVQSLAGILPILGICLGHQAIGEAFGAKVVRAGEIIHGKVSQLRHDGKGSYADIPQGLEVGRYHSLILDRPTLPDCFEVSAELENGMIMGIRHKEYDIEGMQFHPESILTPDGHSLMQNFLNRI